MKNVTIYQVKQGMTREHGFMNLEFLRKITKQSLSISMKHYEVVFGEQNVEGAVFFYTKNDTDTALLDLLFEVTNSPRSYDVGDYNIFIERFGFKGRSISVSDIIRINDAYYYCDSFGWAKIEVTDVPNWITVGMKASGSYHTDITPFEVIKVSPSGKTVYVQEMDWKVVKGGEHDGSAEYEYSSNPDGRIYSVRQHNSGQWKTPCGMRVAFGNARRYYDPHF